jgi:hypothetical protein
VGTVQVCVITDDMVTRRRTVAAPPCTRALGELPPAGQCHKAVVGRTAPAALVGVCLPSGMRRLAHKPDHAVFVKQSRARTSLRTSRPLARLLMLGRRYVFSLSRGDAGEALKHCKYAEAIRASLACIKFLAARAEKGAKAGADTTDHRMLYSMFIVAMSYLQSGHAQRAFR